MQELLHFSILNLYLLGLQGSGGLVVRLCRQISKAVREKDLFLFHLDQEANVVLPAEHPGLSSMHVLAVVDVNSPSLPFRLQSLHHLDLFVGRR